MALLDKYQPNANTALQRGAAPRSRIQAMPSGHSDPRQAAGTQDWLIVQGVKKTFKKRMVVKGVSINVRRG